MAEIDEVQPPSWMRRHQKREFARVIAARKAQNRPVKPAEADAVEDYVLTRLRISDLQMRLDRARLDRDFLQLSRAINSALAMSRALARDLGLVEMPAKPSGKKAAERATMDDGSDGWLGLIGGNREPARNGQ